MDEGWVERVGRKARDAAFQSTFQGLFVYSILFEDSEVDEEILELDERSRVLAITGAGCGVAAMMARNPESIDAVDLNPHHLALSALKIEASRRLVRYSSFYDLLGRGWHPDAEHVLAQATLTLPDWIRKHWKSRARLFHRNLYREGVTSRMLGAFRAMAGVDETWLRWAAGLDPDGRASAVETKLGPLLRSPVARAWLTSPGQLVALGINFSQRDRILRTEGDADMADFIISHLKRLARTDVGTNWFIWYAIAGHFDHEREDAVPPYLRRDRHARAREATTRVRYHRRNVVDVLEASPPRSYTHFTFCDAPDWLDAAGQRRLLDGVLRTAKDGAVVLTRSVEHECMVERAGLGRRLVRLDDLSTRASIRDRTRQYRRVDAYQVMA
jgi:S-adenosylmethionine-diacylglycerol 3-amino-3-carboxypropyl transferase